jgi:transposase
VQKEYIAQSTTSPRHLRVLYDMFGNTELKLGKSAAKLPPISHNVTITKRINGKWILNIPCAANYVRQRIASQPTAICGVDPGANTFLTVFDETNKEANKLGDYPERRALQPLMNQMQRLNAESLRATHRASQLETASKRRHKYELERDHKALAARRIYRQVRDKVTGIHNAIVRHFTERYAFVAIKNFHGVVRRRRVCVGRDPLNLWRVRDFQAKL